MPFIKKCNELGITEDDFNIKYKRAFQQSLAIKLRAKAIYNLRNGTGKVATGFRTDYEKIANESKQLGLAATYSDFLDGQKQNGSHGTDLEAASLGEIFACNVVVTTVNKIKNRLVEQRTFCIYKADERSPTVHLYCVDNHHWYTQKNKPRATLGDGNCLYNGFAQELEKIYRTEKNKESVLAVNELKSHGFFKEIVSDDVREHQQKIYDAIKKTSTTDDFDLSRALHDFREASLSEKEIEMMYSDLTHAEDVARNEIPQDFSYPTIYNTWF
jgi:hypothetical protein